MKAEAWETVGIERVSAREDFDACAPHAPNELKLLLIDFLPQSHTLEASSREPLILGWVPARLDLVRDIFQSEIVGDGCIIDERNVA